MFTRCDPCGLQKRHRASNTAYVRKPDAAERDLVVDTPPVHPRRFRQQPALLPPAQGRRRDLVEGCRLADGDPGNTAHVPI